MTITIYTSNGWGPCHATKGWLNINGYQFEEKNVSENMEYGKELMAMGYRSTPVVVIKNPFHDESIVGFNPNKLKDALNRLS